MFNPDYPDMNSCGGFLQHTYQQPQTNPYDSMYYGGGSVNPFDQFGGNNVPPDSRRNIGYPNQAVNGMSPQQPMMNNPGQQPVMPFSSYPSGVPNNQNTPSLNSLVESRRNMSANNNPVSSPWSNQNRMVPQQTMVVNPTPQMQPMMPQQTTHPWSNPYGYAQVETSMMDLYNNRINEFDRTNPSWDNMYTTPRQIEAPPVNWNTGFNQPNCVPMANGNNMYSYQYNCPQYPKMNMSYLDIAKNNFANV